jgi:hypothetical protein
MHSHKLTYPSYEQAAILIIGTVSLSVITVYLLLLLERSIIHVLGVESLRLSALFESQLKERLEIVGQQSEMKSIVY